MRYLSLLLIGFISMSSHGESRDSFVSFVKQLRVEAIESNISEATVKQSLGAVKQFKRALRLGKREKPSQISLEAYLKVEVPPWKVKKARQLFIEHRQLLDKIAEKYQVQPRFILAIWGIETGFSKKLSSYPAMSVLISLAHQRPDNQLLRAQIFAMLTALEQDPSHQADFRSDWSGQLGMINFSVLNYLSTAQDFDSDGFSDIWRSNADAFASLAKFLADNGWDNKQTWGRQVKIPSGFSAQDFGLAKTKTLTQWQTLGVRRFNGKNLPRAEMKATLVTPDGVNGRIFLVYNNYKTLLAWKDSAYFTSAVGYLADRIKFPPIKR